VEGYLLRFETTGVHDPKAANDTILRMPPPECIDVSPTGAPRTRRATSASRFPRSGPEQWLLTEWPAGETAPKKFWLSNLPPKTSVTTLVRFAKLRWRVERDYQELKQEIGLDHFEGRTWRGFHHHAALCAVAHGFLALRRALFPPEPSEMDDLARPEGPAAGAPLVDRHLSALP
jgi:hypothetical protein